MVARSRGHFGLFATIMFALLALLTVAAKEIIGNEISDAVIGTLARMTGIQDIELVRLVQPYILPLLSSTAILFVMYRVSVWHLRQTIFADDPTLSALLLPQMSIYEMLEYIRDKSKWGWIAYAKYNSKEMTAHFALYDCERAAESIDIRMVGRQANSHNVEVIDPGYWSAASLDYEKIINGIGGEVTKPYVFSYRTPPAYSSVSSPRVDVYRAWPQANIVQKLAVRVFVLWKIAVWYRLPDRWIRRRTKNVSREESQS